MTPALKAALQSLPPLIRREELVGTILYILAKETGQDPVPLIRATLSHDERNQS